MCHHADWNTDDLVAAGEADDEPSDSTDPSFANEERDVEVDLLEADDD
jgi:hypothetical protein